MPNRVRILTIPDAERAELERRARDRGAPARVAERARIVLLAGDGLTGSQIAERAGCTEPTVIKWRRQYAEAGLAGLEDAPRPGGPKTVLTDEAVCEILAATVTPPPGSLQAQGVTHWSARRLADWLRRTRKITVSHDSIARLWRKFCLQPHRTEGFKFSTDPQLEAKVADVVGLYLHPPENAVVVCVDEKSQCQALERAQPILPPGIPAFPQEGRRRLPRHRPARDLRQLLHPQARRGPQVAGQAGEQADHPALHADRMLVDQPRGMLLLRDHPASHPPRLLYLRQGTHRNHRRLHRSLERPPSAVRLDQGRRRDPRQHPPSQD
jgi:transposase